MSSGEGTCMFSQNDYNELELYFTAGIDCCDNDNVMADAHEALKWSPVCLTSMSFL